MLSLTDIRKPIQKELEEFRSYFTSAMKTKVRLLDLITGYVLRRKGKQIRPMFVFFSAKLFGEICPSTQRAAALIELLHTATLIHDDVVDDAEERRSFFSLNALWKNKAAVLVGDFLLSRGLLLSLENRDYRMLEIVAQAVRQMSEGELLQIEKARSLNVDEEVYFEIIRQKTATLIASSCACGAASVTDKEEDISRIWSLGEKIGIAFQIKDDLLDYGEGGTGKPLSNDIIEKKMTLPLIYALSKTGWMERRKIISLIRSFSDDSKKLNRIICFVKDTGGINYALNTLDRYRNEATALLMNFPDNSARKSIKELIDYTVERNN